MVARGLHATSHQLQWIVDAYALVYGGLVLVGGSLADRVGRKRTIVLAGSALALVTVPARARTSAPPAPAATTEEGQAPADDRVPPRS